MLNTANSQDKKTKGLVIITGQPFDGEEMFLLRNLQEVIKNRTTTDVLHINLAGTDTALEEIREKISHFANHHDEVDIISAAHGFHVLPFARHETNIGKLVLDNTIMTYLHSFKSWLVQPADAYRKYVLTEDYLKTIASATGDKLNVFWHSSCQSSQLIDVAQKILPQGSVYITESQGYSTMPEALFAGVNAMLSATDPFDMYNLLLHYTFKVDGSRVMYQYEYTPYSGYNIDPYITKIGQNKAILSAKTEKFIQEVKAGNVSPEQWALITAKLDKIYSGDSWVHHQLNHLKSTQEGEVCVSHIGEKNYLLSMGHEYLVAPTLELGVTLINKAIELYDPLATKTYNYWEEYYFRDKVCIPNVLGELAYPEDEMFAPVDKQEFCPVKVDFS